MFLFGYCNIFIHCLKKKGGGVRRVKSVINIQGCRLYFYPVIMVKILTFVSDETAEIYPIMKSIDRFSQNVVKLSNLDYSIDEFLNLIGRKACIIFVYERQVYINVLVLIRYCFYRCLIYIF